VITFFHTRHVCGHSVYWSDPAVGMAVARAPCPWCGAETGKPVPKDVNFFRSPRDGTMAFRRRLPDSRAPWPEDLPLIGDGEVAIQHQTGDVCCLNEKPHDL
jgi:hypothetical protein